MILHEHFIELFYQVIILPIRTLMTRQISNMFKSSIIQSEADFDTYLSDLSYFCDEI